MESSIRPDNKEDLSHLELYFTEEHIAFAPTIHDIFITTSKGLQ